MVAVTIYHLLKTWELMLFCTLFVPGLYPILGVIMVDCVKFDTLLRKCLKMRQSRVGVAHGIAPRFAGLRIAFRFLFPALSIYKPNRAETGYTRTRHPTRLG